MRWKWSVFDRKMSPIAVFFVFFILCSFESCEARSRRAQRRKDGPSRTPYIPSPSVETLSELAAAMGAAGFEHRTEGKALVKRLIPENSEPDLDEIAYQGVIGKPGVDFPAFPSIPMTGFNCKNVPTGYYADLETECQVFHICDTSRKISFLCPNGTIFSQSHLICDWWFKVDCASAPALYQSSAEYYSNEQKKTLRVNQNLNKNQDLQQITDSSNLREKSLRRTTFTVTPVTTSTEKPRQRSRFDYTPPIVRTTVRTYEAIFAEPNYPSTPRPQIIEKRRKNLVQLIANNFAQRTTLPTYTDASTYRSPAGDYNGLKEMQIAAETASFTNNNNRQFIQDYNKNIRQYPVYTPTVNSRVSKTRPTQSALTPLFVHDIRDSNFPDQAGYINSDITTKRSTLVPYTKSYTYTNDEKHEPYTRPGVNLLKDYLDKEKNKTSANNEVVQAAERNDQLNAFESATKVPTTRSDGFYTVTASSDKFETFSNNYQSTEPNYHERRERLMRKLNIAPTEPTITTMNTEKYFGSRPGLIVPPSLTPKTLHTLAIYYATALDNMATTTPPEDDTETTTPISGSEEIDNTLPALFSRHTLNKYSNLFQPGMDNSDLLEEIKLDPNGTSNELIEDLMIQQSQNALSSSPQIRELAQVFTHALSAYLQDPVQFRKALSDIRPTHPTFNEMITTPNPITEMNTEPTTTTNEEDDELLGFSDENKSRPALAQIRDLKLLKTPEIYSRLSEAIATTPTHVNTEVITTPQPTTQSTTTVFTTPRSPFRCCGRISASYTTESPQKDTSTATPFTNTVAVNIRSFPVGNITENVDTTENSYAIPKYGGFQNNTQDKGDSPYGNGFQGESKPLNGNNYIQATNLPSAWGVDNSVTKTPLANSNNNVYDTNNIGHSTVVSISTTTPQYITQTESVEVENEEELQRAYSQSFVTPQNSIQRQGTDVNFESEKLVIKKPSEELEAPTLPDDYDTTISETTTAIPVTTYKIEEQAETTVSSVENIYFTAPGNDNQFQWKGNFGNWHSTAILDPITVNDALSPTGTGGSQLSSQATAWGQSNVYNTGTTQTEYTGPYNNNQLTNEQTYSSSQPIPQSTPSSNLNINQDVNTQREGRQLKLNANTEPTLDITTIQDTVVEKAKEIMGEMNSTTTEKLINVMKKTKSKTVKRLILLLVQTCDDDHNSTAEASKKALLEALMSVSQQDMEEIAKEDTNDNITTTPNYEIFKTTSAHRRMDGIYEGQEFRSNKKPKGNQRTGKSINYEATDINSLTNPTTTERVLTRSSEEITDTTILNTTPSGFVKTTPNSKRGVRKFLTRSNSETKTIKAPTIQPIAEARVAPSNIENKTNSDTRAIELLRSLYTIAARWG